MNDIDERVKSWLLAKFIKNRWSEEKHGPADQIQIIDVEAGWNCLCYSEWTRDDTFDMEALFNSARGTFYWTYGAWGDLPTFIKELSEYQDASGSCPYEEDF